MIQSRSVLVSQSDHARLQSLIKKADPASVELLFEEIDAATIVPDAELPADVVAMGSVVTFEDLDSGKESTMVLAYPQQASGARDSVSVLAPVGAALIGLRVGETIEWPLPNGAHRRLRVVRVASAAEA